MRSIPIKKINSQKKTTKIDYSNGNPHTVSIIHADKKFNR